MNPPISRFNQHPKEYLLLEILMEFINVKVTCFISPLHLIGHLIKSDSDLRVMALLPAAQCQNQQISIFYNNSPLKYFCQLWIFVNLRHDCGVNLLVSICYNSPLKYFCPL